MRWLLQHAVVYCLSPESCVHPCYAEFIKKFRPHVSSTMNDPCFPSDFLPKEDKTEGDAPAAVPDKLTLNFFLPYETTMKDSKVRMTFCATLDVADLQHLLN